MIYLDHHATTPLDPKVLDAMMPFLTTEFANAGSVTHELGRRVQVAIQQATASIAAMIGADADEVIMTSGATESNNLAAFGFCLHPRQKRRKVISCATEHRAMLDPLKRLAAAGFEIVNCPIKFQGEAACGQVDLDALGSLVDDNTAFVSLMLANNEVGTIQPIRQVADLCQQHGAVLHTDATQAVGRMPIDVDELGVDLMSFSAHKFYGPKGIGGMYVRSRGRRISLVSQIVGGGHQNNVRSGTLNSPGIIGMEAALRFAIESLDQETLRVRTLRNRLWQGLCSNIADLRLNGPKLDPAYRMDANLNCEFPGIEGQAIMQMTPELCASSGSACTSAMPHPSHVLTAIGLSEDQARCSLRFGIGRFNTTEQIDTACSMLLDAYQRLRQFSE